MAPERPRTGTLGATVVRTVTREGSTTFTLDKIDVSSIPRADRVLAVDCGKASVRFGCGEICFGQLDPFQPNILARAVVVRFDIDRFVERVRANEPFRALLELEERDASDPVSSAIARFEQAQKHNTAAVVVDADLEVMTRLGKRGVAMFITFGAANLHSAVAGSIAEFAARPEVEVSMAVGTMSDILNSWKAAVDELGRP